MSARRYSYHLTVEDRVMAIKWGEAALGKHNESEHPE